MQVKSRKKPPPLSKPLIYTRFEWKWGKERVEKQLYKLLQHCQCNGCKCKIYAFTRVPKTNTFLLTMITDQIISIWLSVPEFYAYFCLLYHKAWIIDCIDKMFFFVVQNMCHKNFKLSIVKCELGSHTHSVFTSTHMSSVW